MATKSFRKIEFPTWVEARAEIKAIEDHEDGYKQVDFYSYKDGSGYAVLESEWDWAVVRIEWNA